jgi:hypothetical protein
MQEAKEEKRQELHPAAEEQAEKAEAASMEAARESAGSKKRKRLASAANGSTRSGAASSSKQQKEREDAAKAKVARKRGAPQAFVQKLFQMLNEEPREVISWSEEGTGFFIHDLRKLADDVLPKYFRRKKKNK